VSEETKDEAASRPTFDDAYSEITGHDGRAVIKAFDGVSVDDLMLRLFQGELDGTGVVILVQMMEFVRLRHDGKSDENALKAVLDMPRKDITELATSYMAEDPEPFPEDPVTDLGKGDSEPA
jgi:hypothetical protein